MSTPYGFTSLGYIQVTGLSSATGLIPVPAGAIMALIACSGNAVRWRDDGTNPSASVGMPLAVGQEFQYAGDMAKILFIQQTSGTATTTLDVTFYR